MNFFPTTSWRSAVTTRLQVLDTVLAMVDPNVTGLWVFSCSLTSTGCPKSSLLYKDKEAKR